MLAERHAHAYLCVQLHKAQTVVCINGHASASWDQVYRLNLTECALHIHLQAAT
jgi:hypothetical protein